MSRQSENNAYLVCSLIFSGPFNSVKIGFRGQAPSPIYAGKSTFGHVAVAYDDAAPGTAHIRRDALRRCPSAGVVRLGDADPVLHDSHYSFGVWPAPL